MIGAEPLFYLFQLGIFGAVRAAGPAAGPAFAFGKVHGNSFYVLGPCFRFLGGSNPADPLIAREWRNIRPHRSRLCGSGKGFA
jgi:hypothetical protein